MLSYATLLLPQCSYILGHTPNPMPSKVKVPHIVGRTLEHYTIVNMLEYYTDVDSYYQLVMKDIHALFESRYLMVLLVQKYKLPEWYYRHILKTYLRGQKVSTDVLKYTVEWYPNIRKEFAEKHAEYIRQTGLCHAFPDVPVITDSSHILTLLNRAKYDEVCYLIDFIEDLDIDIVQVNPYSSPIKLLSRLISEPQAYTDNYVIAYTRVHDKLPHIVPSNIINLDIALLYIKYGKEITEGVIDSGDDYISSVECLLGSNLTPDVKTLCDKFVSIMIRHKLYIALDNDNPVMHYISALLALNGYIDIFELDDCEVCGELIQRYPKL